MTILKAEAGDLREILSLQYLAYQSEARLHNDPNIPPLRQTLADVQREFAEGLFLKAVDTEGAIVGSVRAYSKNGTLYIGKLIVRPDRQGQGIGTQLLLEIERAWPHDRCELFTSRKSVRNIKLYQRHGYREFYAKQAGPGLTMVYMEKRPGA